MNVCQVKWNQTNLLSKLVHDYLEGKSELEAFYHTTPSLEGIKQFSDSKVFDINQRNTLIASLTEQYIQAGLAVPENLVSLSNKNSFTITTGHQLCLFGGPAYFIYKIVSSIKLANQLNHRYPEMNFIPVFWMATEDHDVDEIDHVKLHEKSINAQYPRPNISGRISTLEARNVLNLFIDELGLSKPADQLANIFRKAFKHDTLAQATRFWVHELFKEFGLLVVDGDDPNLKTLFKPVFEREIVEGITVKTVGSTNQNLESNGYKIQVNPRDINLFYLDGNQRHRIIKDKSGNLLTESGEILMIAHSSYELYHLSPNVLLRPLYQELILPNAAYVGGGGEIAYWLQLKSLFEAFGLSMPALILRDSFAWLPGEAFRWLQVSGLKIDEVFMDENHQKKLILERAGYLHQQFEAEKTTLQVAMDMIAKKIESLNPSLEFSAKALKTDTLNRLKVLEDKIWRETKKRENEKLTALQKMRTSLLPNSALEERTVSAFSKIGQFETIESFLGFLIDSANPLGKSITIIGQEKFTTI